MFPTLMLVVVIYVCMLNVIEHNVLGNIYVFMLIVINVHARMSNMAQHIYRLSFSLMGD